MGQCDVVYVDGFAGPNEYTNPGHPHGSPTAAVNAISTTLSDLGSECILRSVKCYFIEDRRDRYDHLVQSLGSLNPHPRVQLYPLHGTFEDRIADVQRENPMAFSGRYPLLVFADPFGATGIPFNMVRRILESPCSEILLNFDADGHFRNIRDNPTILDEALGTAAWRTEVRAGAPMDMSSRKLVVIMKRQLLALPNVKYVFHFEMQNASNDLNYVLIFASQHPRGLEKMKESMRKMDQTGTNLFSDGSVNQFALFRDKGTRDASQRFHSRFTGRTISGSRGYDEMTTYALNETGDLNPIAMLRILEVDGLVDIKRKQGKRSNSWNSEAVEAVTFLREARNGKAVQGELEF